MNDSHDRIKYCADHLREGAKRIRDVEPKAYWHYESLELGASLLETRKQYESPAAIDNLDAACIAIDRLRLANRLGKKIEDAELFAIQLMICKAVDAERAKGAECIESSDDWQRLEGDV